MPVGTMRSGGRDGTLAVVTPAGDRALFKPGGIPTLQAAVDEWQSSAPVLQSCYKQLIADEEIGQAVRWEDFHSPLPAAYEWSEASAYLGHMERIRRARGIDLPADYRSEPIVYQAGAGRLRAPFDAIPLPDPSWCLDLEATVAVITDDVPIGTGADAAAEHVLFVVLTNDLTYRALMGRELTKAIGPYQAKPARAFAPMAVSPQELGDLWDGRILRATVKCWVNGELLGALPADRDYGFDFGDVLAHMTRTRGLRAGSIVGLGTVSSRDESNGFGCLAEKRALETMVEGQPSTPWLTYGDTVKIEAFNRQGTSIFGPIQEQVVRPGGPAGGPGQHR
jgi:fumarylacetoacetate (FAA) hydrolase